MTILRTPRTAAPGGLGRAAQLALAAGLLLPLLLPAQARAYGRGWHPGYRPVPVQQWQPAPVQRPLLPVSRPQVIYDYPSSQVFAGQPVFNSVEEQARRCNQGRLVGGLMGGGAGYVLAKGNDRVWATPLGALLGSQMGCNAVQGRAPLPW
ncbi:MAG: glycine zipper 2TM domain-containing protein [Cyanobium sp. Prado107]|jgi:hypothetical protein|nr:glycine zipper 2TM domain-containing protein [Cyanobium sp. Prado107]